MNLAEEVIRKEYQGSTNMMTPEVLRCGLRGDFAYEVSKGEGFSRNLIWGLSVVEYEATRHGKVINTNRRTDLSCCCHSERELLTAIEALAEEAATI